jgi:hypothetical protein
MLLGAVNNKLLMIFSFKGINNFVVVGIRLLMSEMVLFVSLLMIIMRLFCLKMKIYEGKSF